MLEHFKVALRIRPLLPSEEEDDPRLSADSNHNFRMTIGDEFVSSSFDTIFRPDATNDDILNYIAPYLTQSLRGCNFTIFTYGQSGSGKTHTMFGAMLNPVEYVRFQKHKQRSPKKNLTSRNYSVIAESLVFKSFDYVLTKTQNIQIDFFSSIVSIFNEKVYDLLKDPRMRNPLKVRESDEGVFIEGISEYQLKSQEDCLKLLQVGDRNKNIMNETDEVANRSHIIFMMKTEIAHAKGLKKSKFSFCDLASADKFEKEQITKTSKNKDFGISRSLTVLNKVIFALGSGKKTHIPYRDSKLTRVLQDSVGLTTRTILLATISSSVECFNETLKILAFADRARTISMKGKKSDREEYAESKESADIKVTKFERGALKNDKNGIDLKLLKEEIQRFHLENQELKRLAYSSTLGELEKVRRENQRLKHELNYIGSPINESNSLRKTPFTNEDYDSDNYLHPPHEKFYPMSTIASPVIKPKRSPIPVSKSVNKLPNINHKSQTKIQISSTSHKKQNERPIDSPILTKRQKPKQKISMNYHTLTKSELEKAKLIKKRREMYLQGDSKLTVDDTFNGKNIIPTSMDNSPRPNYDQPELINVDEYEGTSEASGKDKISVTDNTESTQSNQTVKRYTYKAQNYHGEFKTESRAEEYPVDTEREIVSVRKVIKKIPIDVINNVVQDSEYEIDPNKDEKAINDIKAIIRDIESRENKKGKGKKRGRV